MKVPGAGECIVRVWPRELAGAGCPNGKPVGEGDCIAGKWPGWPGELVGVGKGPEQRSLVSGECIAGMCSGAGECMTGVIFHLDRNEPLENVDRANPAGELLSADPAGELVRMVPLLSRDNGIKRSVEGSRPDGRPSPRCK